MMAFLIMIAALGPAAPAAGADERPDSAVASPAAATIGHISEKAAGGFAIYGTPRYPPGFSHFAYTNPDAPKGCTIRRAPRIGTFDSLNPFIVKGKPDLGPYDYLYDSLMEPSQDEIGVVYPRLARAMVMAPDQKSVTFHIDPRAQWHDGVPITADDVAYTVNLFAESGRPFWRSLFRTAKIERAEGLIVRFSLPDEHPRDAAAAISDMRILPAHFWRTREFDRTSLEIPLGSGPYRIADVEPGRSVTYERVPGYWGRDLPSMRGAYNFDRIVHEYFFNPTTAFEAFLRGNLDIHIENDVRRWKTGYDNSDVASGRIIRLDQPNWFTIGMNGYFFNLRQPRFADIRVRKALELLFDFEWVNKNIFHDSYRRTASFFQNSRFAATEPPTAAEAALMREHPRLFPPEAYERAWRPTENDGTGLTRNRAREALGLLAEAGWKLDNGRLLNVATGEPFTFTVLAQTASQEKVLGQYFESLRRFGIRGQLQIVDGATYEHRLRTGQYDLAYRFIIQPQWPGREQRRFWGSKDESRAGENMSGLADPDIDALVESIVTAENIDDLTLRARILDRALQWAVYAIPGFHESHRHVAYWKRIQRPAIPTKYGYGLEYWWCGATDVDGR